MKHGIISHYFPAESIGEARKIYATTYDTEKKGKKREVSPLLSAEVVGPELSNDNGYLRHLVQAMDSSIFHEIMQFNRLNESSKTIINDAIDKDVTRTEEVYALNWPNRNTSNTIDEYVKLKNYAERLAEKYEKLSRQLVREHQDGGWNGWKPFFKNLLTLFGLGTSAFSRLFFGEYLYGDKLTLPQSALEGLKTEVPFDDPDIIVFSDVEDDKQSFFQHTNLSIRFFNQGSCSSSPISENNQPTASHDTMSIDQSPDDPPSSHSL